MRCRKPTLSCATLIGLALLLSASAPAGEDNALFPAAKGDKWGYIDRAGKMVIEARYEDAEDFHEGLARVTIGGKTELIDAAGHVAVKPQFNVVRDLSEGVAAVNIGEKRYASLGIIQNPGKWGYIDKMGKPVLPLKYTLADSFSEGLAAVHDGSRSGFIDHSGKMIFEAPFDVSWGLHEDMVLVKSKLKMTYFDRAGKRLPTPPLDDNYFGHDFSQGLAAVQIKGKWGYIDKTGKLVIAPQFIEAENFNDGLAAVELPIDQAREKPCVMTGNPPSSYTVAKKYAYIDRTGKVVIPPLFEVAGPFVEGLANVSNCDIASFIDKSGKVAFAAQFRSAAAFSNGLAAVEIGDYPNSRKAYIDRQGKTVWTEAK